MSINSDFFLIWGLNYDMDMFLADLPVTSVSEIMFYTYVILNLKDQELFSQNHY